MGIQRRVKKTSSVRDRGERIPENAVTPSVGIIYATEEMTAIGREVTIHARVPVHPYVPHITRNRYPSKRAEAYEEWRSRLNAGMGMLLQQKQIMPFVGVPIELLCTFYTEHIATGKPDLSNLLKAVEDAMTGALWDDDRFLVEVCCRKMKGEQAGFVLIVREWKATP